MKGEDDMMDSTKVSTGQFVTINYRRQGCKIVNTEIVSADVRSLDEVPSFVRYWCTTRKVKLVSYTIETV